MVLSLNSIHQALNDFFLKQFATDAGSPALFRFDQLGSILSEQDFIVSLHPELGYSPPKAKEKFSELVNRVPVDVNDGMNIYLSEIALIPDTYYYNLLKPSIPAIPYNADEATKQSTINTFSSIKADALRVWEDVKPAESLEQFGDQYKPCLATPEIWYDITKNEVWTHQSFTIAATDPAPASGSSGQLWRLRLSSEAMQRILQSPEMQTTVSQLNAVTASGEQMLSNAASGQEVLVQNAAIEHTALSASASINPSIDISAAVVNNASLYNTFAKQYYTLDISKRLVVSQYIANNASTRPLESSSVTISFDYCLVRVRRPWYVDMFINQNSWYIPGVLKGQVKLPLMPIGFVAIRNLAINGNWTSEDMKNATEATHFGPFQVSIDPVTHQLGHSGLQIVGWLLQKMPALPPNQPPQYEEAAKTLSIKTDQLISGGFKAVIQQFPNLIPPTATHQTMATCMRDIHYFLQLVIDSCSVGSTKPIDDVMSGLKDTSQALGFSIVWIPSFCQYVKSNHGLSGDAAAIANEYLDYAANAIS